MEWKKGQWVRCDFSHLKMVGGDFPKDSSGNFTQELVHTHCYYKILGIQKSKGTFTVYLVSYKFSLEDGSVFIGGEKAPHWGKASHLNEEDQKYLDEVLKDHPNSWMIYAKKEG